MASIPVIILSNLGQKEDVDKGLSLGAAYYLIKAHFTPGEIIEKVRNHLK
jgi:DNA-binding response OmpR family regulator